MRFLEFYLRYGTMFTAGICAGFFFMRVSEGQTLLAAFQLVCALINLGVWAFGQRLFGEAR